MAEMQTWAEGLGDLLRLMFLNVEVVTCAVMLVWTFFMVVVWRVPRAIATPVVLGGIGPSFYLWVSRGSGIWQTIQLPWDVWAIKLMIAYTLPILTFVFYRIILRPLTGIRLFQTGDTMDMLESGLTGVRSQYRRVGLATALKCKSLEAAKHLGAKRVQTSNEENNPMYQLILQLGFRPRPAEVDWKKVLTK